MVLSSLKPVHCSASKNLVFLVLLVHPLLISPHLLDLLTIEGFKAWDLFLSISLLGDLFQFRDSKYDPYAGDSHIYISTWTSVLNSRLMYPVACLTSNLYVSKRAHVKLNSEWSSPNPSVCRPLCHSWWQVHPSLAQAEAPGDVPGFFQLSRVVSHLFPDPTAPSLTHS